MLNNLLQTILDPRLKANTPDQAYRKTFYDNFIIKIFIELEEYQLQWRHNDCLGWKECAHDVINICQVMLAEFFLF